MYLTASKKCINCQFWDGDRVVSHFRGDQAESTNQNVMGKCTNRNSLRREHKKLACEECSDFVKWDKLK